MLPTKWAHAEVFERARGRKRQANLGETLITACSSGRPLIGHASLTTIMWTSYSRDFIDRWCQPRALLKNIFIFHFMVCHFVLPVACFETGNSSEHSAQITPHERAVLHARVIGIGGTAWKKNAQSETAISIEGHRIEGEEKQIPKNFNYSVLAMVPPRTERSMDCVIRLIYYYAQLAIEFFVFSAI